MKPKIIGLLCAWNCENYIGLAIEQALKFCDEVIVNVSAHSEILEKYVDETYNIAKSYIKYIKFIDVKYNKSNHSIIKAGLLNFMLSRSENYEVGNWIFVLDADEFYKQEIINKIKSIIEENEYTDITFRDYYFFINTNRYLVGEHQRLFRINEENLINGNVFFPTQNWYCTKKKSVILGSIKNPTMFHYGLLTNPFAKLDFWLTEYPNNTQSKKVNWLDKIYRNYNFNNEEQYIKLNKELSGINSCWFNDGYIADKDGKPFEFKGKHPDIIPKYILEEEDWRKKFNFN